MQRFIFILVVGGMCFAGPGNPGCTAKAGQTRPEKAAASDDLFANPKVLRIQIDIPRTGLGVLRRTDWQNKDERPTANATVREGGVVYTNVAVHVKGSAGSFRPIDDNPALTLNFSKMARGQTFHGLHKISLNNSVQDPSYLNEQICRELFEAAGVPVPRATHAALVLNGRNLGLRVLVEGFNKQFLERYFDNTRGNLYDGGFCQDINGQLTVNSGDNPKDESGVRALIAAAREPDRDKRLARLEQTLDLESFLSLLAMDIIQDNWDGYARNRNNWRIFHDLDSNRMFFFPHGLDQMFGVDPGGNRGNPNSAILPRMQGMVALAVIGTSEGRRRYFDRLGQLCTNVFKVETLLKRVDQLSAVVHPVVAEAGPEAARQHDEEVQRFKRRIVQRGESLRRQLAMVDNVVKVPTNSTMRLAGWQPRAMGGSPSFRKEQGTNGESLLYIAAGNGSTIGSWRTQILLEPGNYRFEGRLQTKDVKLRSGEPNAGAGLRISGGAVPQGISGTTEWRAFAYPFRVQEGGGEMEFICELRASNGEVWFDIASLQAVRVR